MKMDMDMDVQAMELVKMDMDKQAMELVRDYIAEKNKYSSIVDGEMIANPPMDRFFEVFIVWKCKALQNWKYLISSTLLDGMYYEMTYNGDKDEWYLDAYKHVDNRCVIV